MGSTPISATMERLLKGPFFMLYTVYILFSKNHGKIYIGYTSNLIMRFHSHNTHSTKDWTHNFRPWIVIYCEYFDDKAEPLQYRKR